MSSSDYISNNNPSEENIQSLLIFNSLNDLLNRLNNISIIELKFLDNLKEWNNQSHQLIEQFCKEKSDQYYNQTKEKLQYFQDTIHFILHKSNSQENSVHSMKQLIELIEENLNQLENIPREFPPLEIDPSIIEIPSPMKDIDISPFLDSNLSLKTDIDKHPFSSNEPLSNNREELSSYHFRLSAQKSFYPYLISPKKRIEISSDNWSGLSSNDKHLLVMGKSHIYLFNQHLNIVQQKYFSHRGIKDICWSNTLQRFILISPKQISTIDEKTMIIKPLKIYFNINQAWERGTCSSTYLFLSTFGENPFVIQFNLYPTIQFNQKYQKEFLQDKSEMINDIKSNENSIAIIIENPSHNQSRFELRLVKSFHSIWNVELGNGWSYRSTFFNHHHWIISDYYNQHFIHILNDGTINRIENYFSKPSNIVSWIEQQIVIRTIDAIYIHQSQ